MKISEIKNASASKTGKIAKVIDKILPKGEVVRRCDILNHIRENNPELCTGNLICNLTVFLSLIPNLEKFKYNKRVYYGRPEVIKKAIKMYGNGSREDK